MSDIPPLFWDSHRVTLVPAIFISTLGENKFTLKSFDRYLIAMYDPDEYDIVSTKYPGGLFSVNKIEYVAESQYKDSPCIKMAYDHYPFGKGKLKNVGRPHTHITYIVSTIPEITPEECMIEGRSGAVIFLADIYEQAHSREIDGDWYTLVKIKPWTEQETLSSIIKDSRHISEIKLKLSKAIEDAHLARYERESYKMNAEANALVAIKQQAQLKLASKVNVELMTQVSEYRAKVMRSATEWVDRMVVKNELLPGGDKLIHTEMDEQYKGLQSMVQGLQASMQIDGDVDEQTRRLVFMQAVKYIGGVEEAQRMLSVMDTTISGTGKTIIIQKEPTPGDVIHEKINQLAQTNIPPQQAVADITEAVKQNQITLGEKPDINSAVAQMQAQAQAKPDKGEKS